MSALRQRYTRLPLSGHTVARSVLPARLAKACARDILERYGVEVTREEEIAHVPLDPGGPVSLLWEIEELDLGGYSVACYPQHAELLLEFFQGDLPGRRVELDGEMCLRCGQLSGPTGQNFPVLPVVDLPKIVAWLADLADVD